MTDNNLYVQNFKPPNTQTKIIEEEIQKLLKRNTKENSTSPFNELRKLNEKIIGDKLPLARL